jgi:hypothetical protein
MKNLKTLNFDFTVEFLAENEVLEKLGVVIALRFSKCAYINRRSLWKNLV